MTRHQVRSGPRGAQHPTAHVAAAQPGRFVHTAHGTIHNATGALPLRAQHTTAPVAAAQPGRFVHTAHGTVHNTTGAPPLRAQHTTAHVAAAQPGRFVHTAHGTVHNASRRHATVRGTSRPARLIPTAHAPVHSPTRRGGLLPSTMHHRAQIAAHRRPIVNAGLSAGPGPVGAYKGRSMNAGLFVRPAAAHRRRVVNTGIAGQTVIRGPVHPISTPTYSRPSRRASGLEVGLWSGFGLALVGAIVAACLGPVGLMVAAGFALTALGLGIGALVVSARANSKAAATTSNLSDSEAEQAENNSQPDLGEAARFTPSADAARAATAAAPAANREEESAANERRASPTATRL